MLVFVDLDVCVDLFCQYFVYEFCGWSYYVWFGFLFFIEIVINIGYLCYLFIDDMMEVFVINGEILEFVQQVIVEYKSKVLVGVLEFKLQKVNSFRDVDVEVLLYKVYKDVVDILIFIQVIIY